MSDAVAALQQVLPGVDREVILSVLQSHGGDMERTVESLLAISGQGDPQPPAGHAGAADVLPAHARHSPAERPQSVGVEFDEMLAQALQQEELLQAAAEARGPANIQQHQRRGPGLGDVVQGVSNAISSATGAAYSGLASLVSSTSAFSACMPAAAQRPEGPEGWASTSDRHPEEHRDGDLGISTEDMASGSMAVPGDMQMPSPQQHAEAVPDGSRPSVPSYTSVVHRRGHNPAAKKDD